MQDDLGYQWRSALLFVCLSETKPLRQDHDRNVSVFSNCALIPGIKHPLSEIVVGGPARFFLACVRLLPVGI